MVFEGPTIILISRLNQGRSSSTVVFPRAVILLDFTVLARGQAAILLVYPVLTRGRLVESLSRLRPHPSLSQRPHQRIIFSSVVWVVGCFPRQAPFKTHLGLPGRGRPGARY